MEIRAPFPEYAWPMAWSWVQRIWDRISDDYAPRDRNAWVRLQIDRSQGEGVKTWGVWQGEELGGLIWIEAQNPVTSLSHVIFKKSFWGRTTTVPAMESAYRDVFDSGIRKITMSVFADNHAIRSLARSIGAREEGILRGHTMRGGKAADVVMLSLFREDYEHADTTVGDGGHQRGKLDCSSAIEKETENRAEALLLAGADRHQQPTGADASAASGQPQPSAF